jgi:hypothetical protein
VDSGEFYSSVQSPSDRIDEDVFTFSFIKDSIICSRTEMPGVRRILLRLTPAPLYPPISGGKRCDALLQASPVYGGTERGIASILIISHGSAPLSSLILVWGKVAKIVNLGKKKMGGCRLKGGIRSRIGLRRLNPDNSNPERFPK